jgi:hypothetical protein
VALGSVTNFSGGTISGAGIGVLLPAHFDGQILVNGGDIVGKTYDGVEFFAGLVTNLSTGTITGGTNGILAAGGGQVINSGDITSLSKTVIAVILTESGSSTEVLSPTPAAVPSPPTAAPFPLGETPAL